MNLRDTTTSGADSQAGFYYQNILGALYALDLIELGSPLSSVTFENPSRAKYIDDIIADSRSRNSTEFIQVKWSESSDSSFTLANLTTADDGSSLSLLRKLADGFSRISEAPGVKRIVLFSSKKAGTTTQPRKGFSKSLASFIENFHIPFSDDDSNIELEKAANYSEYEQILQILFPLTGLPDWKSFASFLKCLRFQLAQPDRDTLLLRLTMRLSRLGIDDRQSGLLLNRVVQWSIDRRVIHAEDVLRELGLLDRFVDSLKQNFPVDFDRVVPVPTVFTVLSTVLDSLPSGYILLEGEPGVGKSTTLAMYKAQRRDVAFEYFCFIPNEPAIGNQRLDSTSFIRSICIGLRNAFPDLEFPQNFAEFSKATLSDWLNFLSRQHLKVILIVDGLDYVDNKYRQSIVSNPLTMALDGTLPPGVFMILSSQYIEALPSQVQDEIRSDPRRLIKVSRFGPSQTEDFFRLRHIQLSAENLALTQGISGGVPIYLEYLANRLADLDEYEQGRFLQSVPSIRNGRIDAYHSHLWSSLQHENEIVCILALLAIRQDFTTADDLVELLAIMHVPATALSVCKSLKTISHVLRISDAQGYAIKHESFREFVAEKTSALSQLLNESLIKWYADHPTTNEAWRHRFRHLYELKRFAELIGACDDGWLRESWSQFRPFAEINQNIDAAWKAASEKDDLVEFVRIALMRQRLSLVKEHLSRSEAEIGLFLLELGRPQEALLRVWDGERAISGPVAFA